MDLKVVSYQMAESIDIRSLKPVIPMSPRYADSDELFYIVEAGKYFYVFKYGIVSFLNYSEKEIAETFELLAPFSKNSFEQRLSDEFDILTDAPDFRYGYNKIEIPYPDPEVVRLIMLNVSQSVALDFYNQQTNTLLEETNTYTQMLERKGRINMSGLRLKKYIGRTLNLKNRISANLYIFDSPDETWENEELNKLDLGLKKTFDLQSRFRTIQEGLSIVKDNMELFKDLLQNKNSNTLELVVIILILVEVVNLFIRH